MDISELTGAWDYSTLPANVVLGRDCFLERKASFERFRSERQPGLIFGDRVRAYTWCAFNLEPTGRLTVGNDTTLVGPVFMCADQITIGSNVIISYSVTIADCDFHPKDPRLRLQDAIANAPGGDKSQRPALITKPVVIEDNVLIGIGAILLKGVHIGRSARIGAGAVVTSDVAAGAFVEGNPAQIVLPSKSS
jgi:acetyltransferase-like isoleucine patch superfamily enzyme